MQLPAKPDGLLRSGDFIRHSNCLAEDLPLVCNCRPQTPQSWWWRWPPHPETGDEFLFNAGIMPLIVGMQHPTIEISVGRDGNWEEAVFFFLFLLERRTCNIQSWIANSHVHRCCIVLSGIRCSSASYIHASIDKVLIKIGNRYYKTYNKATEPRWAKWPLIW